MSAERDPLGPGRNPEGQASGGTRPPVADLVRHSNLGNPGASPAGSAGRARAM